MSDEQTVTVLVSNIRLPLGKSFRDAVAPAARAVGLPSDRVISAALHKLSVDGRHGTPVLVYTVALTVPAGSFGNGAALRSGVQLLQCHPLHIVHGTEVLRHPPVVCGLGPAGLFTAYLLAKEGYRPVVLERGPEISRRMQAVEAFNVGGPLDVNANIQFGEGGAGTFSDGKLTTRIHDPLCEYVTQVLLDHGAPPEIALRQKPHIGTDLLRNVITAIRAEIEQLGGTVLFDTKLENIICKGETLCSVKTTRGEVPCEVLALAPGHSARDTFAMLMQNGLQLVCKPFSVGFRAEHLQSEIEAALYHEAAGHPDLPRGEYQLSTHIGGRGVYTFCMCPGGRVVAAASEENTVVTNGMSFHARDGQNANAAVVVSVDEQDFGGDPRQAIAFQRRLEREAWLLGGRDYCAPAQDVRSFLEGTARLTERRVTPTYPRGVRAADLGRLFGTELTGALQAGLRDFDRKISGYAGQDAVLTGVETRTSSPVRILRDAATLQSTEIKGLYPCGEGAGYAGGIVSAAVDGLRVADAIMRRYGAVERV